MIVQNSGLRFILCGDWERVVDHFLFSPAFLFSPDIKQPWIYEEAVFSFCALRNIVVPSCILKALKIRSTQDFASSTNRIRTLALSFWDSGGVGLYRGGITWLLLAGETRNRVYKSVNNCIIYCIVMFDYLAKGTGLLCRYEYTLAGR